MYFLPILLLFAAAASYYFGRQEGNDQFKEFAYIALGLAVFSAIIAYILLQVVTL